MNGGRRQQHPRNGEASQYPFHGRTLYQRPSRVAESLQFAAG